MIQELIEALAKYIQPAVAEYESDTFSATGEEMTEEEARRVALFFTKRFLKGGNTKNSYRDANDLLTDNLGVDGLQVSEVLGWVRGKEVNEQGE